MTSEMKNASLRPIVDVCGTAYDAPAWRASLMSFANEGPNYLRAFGAALAEKAGVAAAAYIEALERSPAKAVELLLDSGGLATTGDDYAEALRTEGIRHQVLIGSNLEMDDGRTVNDSVLEFAKSHRELMRVWAGIDIADMKRGLAEFDRCIALGARGAAIIPFAGPVDPDSRPVHELYGRAGEIGVPVWIHTGMNFSTNKPLHASTWAHLDRIAVAHPNLAIVAGHGGWPWIAEAMAVLQRHKNVYLEFSAHRPRVMGMPGSGWEPLFLYGRGVVRRQVLFGSSSFVQRGGVRALADELLALGLGEKVERAWLHDNAAALLNLPAIERAAAAVG